MDNNKVYENLRRLIESEYHQSENELKLAAGDLNPSQPSSYWRGRQSLCIELESFLKRRLGEQDKIDTTRRRGRGKNTVASKHSDSVYSNSIHSSQ